MPPVWHEGLVRLVDLDLDVIRDWSGRVWVDDEDEFAEHRVLFGYPDDVVRLAMDSCDRVRAAMMTGAAPYDGVTHLPWLERLSAR
jgi:protein associated with RNAse G/E